MNLYETAEVCIGGIGLFLTLLGLILIIFGWIIPYKQSIKIETKRKILEMSFQKIKWEKEIIDQQISRFYGPISALLNEQNVISKRVFSMFDRDCIFDYRHPNLNSFSEEEQRIWMHFIDTYEIPLNHQILEIIRENKHLIYKSESPNCIKTYMDFALGWELLDSQRKNNVPNFYDYHYSYDFPVEFVAYIDHTLKLLLDRQSELTGILEAHSNE